MDHEIQANEPPRKGDDRVQAKISPDRASGLESPEAENPFRKVPLTIEELPTERILLVGGLAVALSTACVWPSAEYWVRRTLYEWYGGNDFLRTLLVLLAVLIRFAVLFAVPALATLRILGKRPLCNQVLFWLTAFNVTFNLAWICALCVIYIPIFL
jgi:hypothetical protein